MKGAPRASTCSAHHHQGGQNNFLPCPPPTVSIPSPQTPRLQPRARAAGHSRPHPNQSPGGRRGRPASAATWPTRWPRMPRALALARPLQPFPGHQTAAGSPGGPDVKALQQRRMPGASAPPEPPSPSPPSPHTAPHSTVPPVLAGAPGPSHAPLSRGFLPPSPWHTRPGGALAQPAQCPEPRQPRASSSPKSSPAPSRARAPTAAPTPGAPARGLAPSPPA